MRRRFLAAASRRRGGQGCAWSFGWVCAKAPVHLGSGRASSTEGTHTLALDRYGTVDDIALTIGPMSPLIMPSLCWSPLRGMRPRSAASLVFLAHTP